MAIDQFRLLMEGKQSKNYWFRLRPSARDGKRSWRVSSQADETGYSYLTQTTHCPAVALARGKREPGQDLSGAAISVILLCEGLSLAGVGRVCNSSSF